MVGRTTELTISELAQLLDLLKKYYDNLIYYANDGQRLDEDPLTIEARKLAIKRIEDCIETIKDEILYRLENN